MSIGNFAELASVVIALAALVYTYSTYTKKYELRSQYRREILIWYTETLDILVRLKLEAKSNTLNVELKRELLAKLSARIDIGRFYFPNVKQDNQFGIHKPIAFQGFRNVVIEFLVLSYEIYSNSTVKTHIGHAEMLQRHFTSAIYEVIDPLSFAEETNKFTNKKFNQNLAFEDYISKDPEALSRYMS